MTIIRTLLLLPLALGLLPAASITMSISAPGEQATFITTALTEDFNSLSTGNRTTSYIGTIGTYQLTTTSAFAILAANQFGGANGSRYMSIGAQSGTTGSVFLQLNADYNYFGFWWSAGDAKNGLSLYDGNQFLARISTADIVAKLTPKTGTVQAVNGNFYNNALYFGNPNNTTQNTGEPYAYVSLVTAGTTFNRIVFDNSSFLSTGFENDNHSVYFGSVTVPGTSVFISTTQTAVPEPGTSVILTVGLLLVGFARLRRPAKLGNETICENPSRPGSPPRHL